MADPYQKDETKEQPYKDALRGGVWVLVLLGIFTAGEFIVAVIAPPWGAFLLLVALLKTVYVVKDYMHVGRLFGGEEESH